MSSQIHHSQISKDGKYIFNKYYDSLIDDIEVDLLTVKNLVDSTEIAINQTENGEYFPNRSFNSVPHSNDGRFVLFVSRVIN